MNKSQQDLVDYYNLNISPNRQKGMSEAQTRSYLIDPFLRFLKYKTEDKNDFVPEYGPWT